MSFLRRKGSDKGFSEPRTVSSLTAAIHTVADYDRGNEVLIAATSSSTPESIAGVFVKAVVSADTTAQVQEIVDGDEYIADMTNNTNANHNYHRMLLTDSATVNNTGTDDTTDAAVVMQIAPVGAASAKKALVRFVRVQDRA
jgi:hypothetical protein